MFAQKINLVMVIRKKKTEKFELKKLKKKVNLNNGL